uniref:Endonuclease/exonuclease/phosphatase domain-containing protein n=1 Tax=Rhodnius prolixus TaxID=13249 RepID=T1HKX8_RHOPR
MVARTGLVVLNVGSTSTFRRPGHTETIPDISLASERLARRIENWTVIEDFTGSDHQYITFQISERIGVKRPKQQETFPRWNFDKMKVDLFSEVLSCGEAQIKSVCSEGKVGAEAMVASTMGLITKACRQSMPRKSSWHGRPPVYWWSPHIANLRKECVKRRRRAQRAGRRP